MKVLITGGGGFIGQRLLRALIAKGALMRGAAPRPIRRIDLCDITPPAVPGGPPAKGIEINAAQGDLADPDFVAGLIAAQYDSIFHLASLLTLAAEQDSARAFAVNVEALRRLMEGARNTPRLVFTSSIAVFGGALPDPVDEAVPPGPATTYGAHKAINELLIADYARKGRVDGRCLRLPIVLTRPGAPQPVVSDMVAGILREPLAGVDITVPIRADTPLTVGSVGAVVRGVIALHDVSAAALPEGRRVHMPALTVTPQQMVEAAQLRGATGAVDFAPDPQVQAIVDGWPRRFASRHAAELGVVGDTDLNAVLDDYQECQG